jgi:hypothetical protein
MERPERVTMDFWTEVNVRLTHNAPYLDSIPKDEFVEVFGHVEYLPNTHLVTDLEPRSRTVARFLYRYGEEFPDLYTIAPERATKLLAPIFGLSSNQQLSIRITEVPHV